MYSLARAVADCFQFRNQIGLTWHSKRYAWRRKRLNVDELNRIAKKLHVQRVMQPYLEAVVL